MKCDEYQSDANCFVDGELDLGRQIGLFQHLTQCNECQMFVDVLVHMKEVKRGEQVIYPTDLDDAIMTRITAGRNRTPLSFDTVKKKQPFWKYRFTMPAPVAVAAAIAAIVFGVIFGHMIQRPVEGNYLPAKINGTGGQPATIIMIYGMPPVEVTGTPLVEARTIIQ